MRLKGRWIFHITSQEWRENSKSLIRSRLHLKGTTPSYTLAQVMARHQTIRTKWTVRSTSKVKASQLWERKPLKRTQQARKTQDLLPQLMKLLKSLWNLLWLAQAAATAPQITVKKPTLLPEEWFEPTSTRAQKWQLHPTAPGSLLRSGTAVNSSRSWQENQWIWKISQLTRNV